MTKQSQHHPRAHPGIRMEEGGIAQGPHGVADEDASQHGPREICRTCGRGFWNDRSGRLLHFLNFGHDPVDEMHDGAVAGIADTVEDVNEYAAENAKEALDVVPEAAKEIPLEEGGVT